MNPVFLTERKDALTEEMNALIDAVVKQHQATEGSEPNKAKNSTEKPNRKRKLQLNTSENKTEKSATSDKKKRDGGDEKEKKSKAKRKTTGERKENQPTQTKTSNRKEKEIAKAQAAEEAALRFFNQPAPIPNSAASPVKRQEPTISLVDPSDVSTTTAPVLKPAAPTISLLDPSEAVSTSQKPPFALPSPLLTSSPLPLTSSNLKYVPSGPAICTAIQPNEENSSMLDLLNSSWDTSQEIFELPHHSHDGLENTSPSSVGSLVKSSIAVLQQSEGEMGDDTTPAKVHRQCSNCTVLTEKIRELEENLKILSK